MTTRHTILRTSIHFYILPTQLCLCLEGPKTCSLEGREPHLISCSSRHIWYIPHARSHDTQIKPNTNTQNPTDWDKNSLGSSNRGKYLVSIGHIFCHIPERSCSAQIFAAMVSHHDSPACRQNTAMKVNLPDKKSSLVHYWAGTM